MNSQTNPNTPPPAPADLPKAPEETPFEKLRKSTVGFPSDAKISAWKAQAPGGRLKVFSPDGVRVFILRGLSGLELASIHNNVPKNASNPDAEVQIAAAAKCTLFTSAGPLTEEALRTGPAGLSESLFAFVQNLSDFYDPVQLFNLSMEL
jgi:hypothetical protein